MNPELVESLEAGCLVLTAHRRQARQIGYRFAATRQVRGIEAWESPRVHSWDDWLVRMHQDVVWSGFGDSRHQRKLLTSFQQRLVWQEVIASSDTPMLDDVAGTARTAMSAWTMLQAYRLPDPAGFPHPNADVAACAQWMRQYLARCRDQSLLDHARLADSLGPALRAGAVVLPSAVRLAGFDVLTPQQRGLIETMRALGVEVDDVRNPGTDNRIRRVQVQSRDEEYCAAGRWVRDILARGDGGSTAVLVPRLSDHRRRIERIFDDILAPGSSLPGGRSTERPYNMAVGDPFLHAPLIGVAFGLCQLAGQSVRGDTLSSLLRSPLLHGAAAESGLRARFDAWLCDQNVTRVPVDRLPALFARFRHQRAPDLGPSLTDALLGRLHSVTSALPPAQRASQWAASFDQLLGAAGWPGDETLDSATFQTAERWRALLEEMGGLDFLTPSMDVRQALALLRSLAQSVRFQPQTPDLSVQILPPEQALGLQFDHVWWCTAHAAAWPEAATPNPFVPLAWQRDRGIPGSSARAQLARAQRLTLALRRGAQDLIVSAPAMVDDHPVSIAPLFADAPRVELNALQLGNAPRYRDTVRRAGALETFQDQRAPAVPAAEAGVPRKGGSRLFALQAACPFRAFGELRLWADRLEEPAPGLSARERGSLLHVTLEYVWRRLGSQEVLRDVLGSESLETEVSAMADRALTEADAKRALPLSARFRTLEHQRLQRRVLRWLDLEAERVDFDVDQAEMRERIELGGITVNLTVDRVDRLASGALAVIDYKTGAASVAEWFGDRPTQPQLPMYALAQGEPVAALAFGLVRPGNGGFAGISREAECLPGIPAWEKDGRSWGTQLEWDALPAYWSGHLARLGHDFATGVASVDPKTDDTCRYCHLGSLCRIRKDGDPADDGASMPLDTPDD